MTRKKKNSFRDRVKKDSERQQSAGSSYGYLNLPSNVKVYAPTPGKSETFDIIPYVVSAKKHPDLMGDFPAEGDQWYKYPIKVHKNVGADNDAIGCPTTIGKKCPICEYFEKRKAAGDDYEKIKSLKAQKRNLYLVVPLGVKDKEEEIHVFDQSQFNFQKIINEEIEEDEDFGDFPSLEEGYSLKCRWSKETFNGNEWAKLARVDFKDRKSQYDEDFIESTTCLDDLLVVLPYAEIKAKFFEEEELDEEEEELDEDTAQDDVEEEEEKPKRKSKKEKEAPKEMELDWDDLVDMDMEELMEVVEEYELDIEATPNDTEELAKAIAKAGDIEVPEEKPKRRKKTPKPKEEEIEEEEEEEVVEKPKRRTKKPKAEEEGEKCPEGFGFGKDTDDYNECDNCELWDACSKKQKAK